MEKVNIRKKKVIKSLNYGLYPANLPRKKKKAAKAKASKWCIETFRRCFPSLKIC